MAKNSTKSKGKTNGVTGEVIAAGGPILDDEGYEILGGGTGQEIAIGEVVEGVFQGISRYWTGNRKGEKVPFYMVGSRAVLGGTVLQSKINEGKVLTGDFLKITRLQDGKAKGKNNPPKIYDVRVKRVSH